jgi:hypothetical protein
MAMKRRKSKHRPPSHEQDEAWLRGEDTGAGFTEFMPPEKLRALWDDRRSHSRDVPAPPRYAQTGSTSSRRRPFMS